MENDCRPILGCKGMNLESAIRKSTSQSILPGPGNGIGYVRQCAVIFRSCLTRNHIGHHDPIQRLLDCVNITLEV